MRIFNILRYRENVRISRRRKWSVYWANEIDDGFCDPPNIDEP